MYVIKRDGTKVIFDPVKISSVLTKAASSINKTFDTGDLAAITFCIKYHCEEAQHEEEIHIEKIQDLVENVLMSYQNGKYSDVAKEYILYRQKRNDIRESNSMLMDKFMEYTFVDSKDSNDKRDNGNVDANTSMGTMLKYGSYASKRFTDLKLMSKKFVDAINRGEIYIHDKDFYPLTLTCCQHDLTKLFTGGFNAGHGYLREPQDIKTYAALACIVIQCAQNDMHGGQSIANFDYDLAPGVAKTFIKKVKDIMEVYAFDKETVIKVNDALKAKMNENNGHIIDDAKEVLANYLVNSFDIFDLALKWTERDTYQAMEALIHNLNTMHSRAGAQVPFSSINYGTDTSTEGRMVIKQLLDAEWAGLGNGETPIFPIHIFRVKDGINGEKGDPNYDLFELACKVSAKRLFPNFEFLDAPFNAQYLKKLPNGEYDPNSMVATMGCRTRIMGNVYDPSYEMTTGRGNLSFSTINLPRIGLKHRGDIDGFFKELDEKIDLVFEQLLERFEVQAKRKVKNFPFLMGQGCWKGSDELNPDDEIREIIKHGTLTTGFIGLAESLTALIGKHHAESEEAQELGLTIISHMRKRCDEQSQKMKLNFSLLATPAEGLSGVFTAIDKKEFGEIKGITDRKYYTNSFHVPVWYGIGAAKKLQIEAPYHALCNGGHISYVELDGDPLTNVPAFIELIQYMKQIGIGYGSVNHPVDHCPICGYTGIIGDECPRCHLKEGQEITYEQLKAIRKECHC